MRKTGPYRLFRTRPMVTRAPCTLHGYFFISVSPSACSFLAAFSAFFQLAIVVLLFFYRHFYSWFLELFCLFFFFAGRDQRYNLIEASRTLRVEAKQSTNEEVTWFKVGDQSQRSCVYDMTISQSCFQIVFPSYLFSRVFQERHNSK